MAQKDTFCAMSSMSYSILTSLNCSTGEKHNVIYVQHKFLSVLTDIDKV